MKTLTLTFSHKALERLDAVSPGDKGSDYSSTINKLLSYPDGTFVQVGEPVYDGLGAMIRVTFPEVVEWDLEVAMKRSNHAGVGDYLLDIISRKLS